MSTQVLLKLNAWPGTAYTGLCSYKLGCTYRRYQPAIESSWLSFMPLDASRHSTVQVQAIHWCMCAQLQTSYKGT